MLGSHMGKLGSLGDGSRRGLFPKSSSQWYPLETGRLREAMVRDK